MSAASTDGPGSRDWAARLTGPLLFLVSLAGAAVIAFFVMESLTEDDDDDSAAADSTLLATYEVPREQGDDPAQDETATGVEVASVFGPDEERPPLPVSAGSGGGAGDVTAGDAAEADEEETPAAGEDGEEAAGTPAPGEREEPADETPGEGAAGDATPAVMTDIAIDPRPGGIELRPDICALGPGPGCPDGVPGTVIGGDDADGGMASEALTAGDLSARALESLDSSDPDYTVHDGCTPPDSTSISLLIESSQPLYNRVAYWPVRYLPGGGDEAAAAASTVELWSDFERDGAVFPFYKCARLDIGTGMAFDVQIRAMDEEGNVVWTPIYEFCRECPIFVGDLDLEDASRFAIESHAHYAAAILDDPPGDGTLEFAYREAPDGRWRSVLSTDVAEGEPFRLLSQSNLRPATEHEFRLTFQTAEPDMTFVSETGTFTTLRRNIILSMSRFQVVDEGDDLLTIAFWLCPSIPGVDTYAEDQCSGGTQVFAQEDPPVLRLEGTERISGGIGGDFNLDIEAGDIVVADFSPAGQQLSATDAVQFFAQVWTSDGEDDCRDPNCHWYGHFRIPGWFPGRHGDTCGEENTIRFRTSVTQRGLPELTRQYFPGDGPHLRPLDLEICVIEVR